MTGISSANPSVGKKLYEGNCYFCHGYNGDAKTVATSYLTPEPVDFTDEEWGISFSAMKFRIFTSIKLGRSGTAMVNFCRRLSDQDIYAIISYIKSAFVDKATELYIRYHTVKNGWKDFAYFAPAFPFAQGNISININRALTDTEEKGKNMYVKFCIGCHEEGGEAFWNIEEDVKKVNIDAVTSATSFAVHDMAPEIAGLTPGEKRGKYLYEKNCAFCHAIDGTGKNFIGDFIEPHPMNFTDSAKMSEMTFEKMLKSIKEGVPLTAMSAWKWVMPEEDMIDIIAYIKRAFV